MVFVKHFYGGLRKEIVKLLRKRLVFKERLAYHKRKVEFYKCRIVVVEEEIEGLERRAKGNFKPL